MNTNEEKEPDWSGSKTLISECWKNPLHPMADRLLMADGAIAFQSEVIANLRSQLAALRAESEPVAWIRKSSLSWVGAANGVTQVSYVFREGEDGYTVPLYTAPQTEPKDTGSEI